MEGDLCVVNRRKTSIETMGVIYIEAFIFALQKLIYIHIFMVSDETMKILKKKIKAEVQEIRMNFKRSLKTVKKSEYWFECSICKKSINQETLFVLDSRNDKYCIECAETILNWQIHRLKLFKGKLRDEGILNEIEED